MASCEKTWEILLVTYKHWEAFSNPCIVSPEFAAICLDNLQRSLAFGGRRNVPSRAEVGLLLVSWRVSLKTSRKWTLKFNGPNCRPCPLQAEQNSQDVPVQLPGGAVMSFPISTFSVKNTHPVTSTSKHISFGVSRVYVCLHFPVDYSRRDHGLWQANGHRKCRRAQRILHPCQQNTRWLPLTPSLIKTESRVWCTSYSRPLCPVSVRGSGASPPRPGVPARLLYQRWLHHLVPEKGDLEEPPVLHHRPLCGLPLPAGDSNSSIPQRNMSCRFGLPLNVFFFFFSRCVFSAPGELPERSADAAKHNSERFAGPASGAALGTAAHRSGTNGAAHNVSDSGASLSNEYTVEVLIYKFTRSRQGLSQNCLFLFVLKSSIKSASQRQPSTAAGSLKNTACLANH